MTFSPNQFLANLDAKGGGLAKPSRFQVIVPIPELLSKRFKDTFGSNLSNLANDFENVIQRTGNATNVTERDPSYSWKNDATRWLSLQCESTELPGKSFTTSDVKIYGPTFRIPNQTTYNDISLTFLSNSEFSERKLFDAWMEVIRSPNTHNFRFPKAKEGGFNYMTQIKIIQYNDFVKQIYALELQDAFPTGISSQQVSWAEDGFHRLTVNFSYYKYRTIYDGKYDTNDILGTIIGTGVSRIQREVLGTISTL
jgi:hypothetical protein